MRLIIHQALKDARMLRWPLLAWVLVLAAFHAVILYVLAVPRPDAELLHALAGTETILSLAGTAAFSVIAVLLVQNDSPATATTFWVTRPISGRAMLASKLLSALLILWVLPLAGDVLDLVAAGVDVRFLPASRFAYELAWLFPLMVIAAITVGLAQFVLVLVIEFLLVVVFSSTGASLGIWGRLYAFDVFAYPLIALALLLLAYQYLTRQTRRAAVMLGVAPLLAAGLAGLVSHATIDTQASTDRALESVSVVVDSGSMRLTDRGISSLLHVPFTLRGLPDGTWMPVGVHKAWLQVGTERININMEEVASEFTGRAATTEEEARQEGTRLLKQALAGATLLNPDPRTRADHLTLIARTRDLQGAGAQPVVLHLELRLMPWVYRPVARVPLQLGASFHTAAMSGRLQDIRWDANGATITVREAEAYWYGMPFAFNRYLVRNRRLNQAILLSARRTRDAFGYWSASQLLTMSLPVSGMLHVQWLPLGIDWRPTAVTSASWLDDAELVAIRVQPNDEIAKTIEVPIGSLRSLTPGG